MRLPGGPFAAEAPVRVVGHDAGVVEVRCGAFERQVRTRVPFR
ncbi:MAG TPA: hypothetical protein RMH99_24410 [Sandaracinaceae bacterium LLY-WYZ-13_1]|nr:hypothetical protein [Sandaracinaceae bacterium LLY-WYZ-13_1]